MGRVNLDQLELIKDQESSCEGEDDRDVMEMADDENGAPPEDEEEAEEEEERDVVEREMDDEEMEGFKEEEEEQEEEVSEDVAEDRHPLQGRMMIINGIIYSSVTSCNWRIIRTPFPRSPRVSHQQLRGERRGEAPPLRVLRPLLHQQPGVGTSRPAPRHVSVFALCTRLSGLFLVFAQTRGAFSWICVCGRIPDICVRQTGLHTCSL